MKIIPPHTLAKNNHLIEVVAQMRQMGSPTIKAVWIEAYAAWLALEGSHRLVAAKQLGIVPIIDEIDYDSEATTDEIIPGSYQDNWTLDQLLETAPINDMIVFED